MIETGKVEGEKKRSKDCVLRRLVGLGGKRRNQKRRWERASRKAGGKPGRWDEAD